MVWRSSSREGARTSTPRLGRKTTSPSASSRRSASRIGVRLTPYCSASCSWRSIVPGGSSPKRIARSSAAPISSAFVVSASAIARVSAISDPGYPNPHVVWATLVWLGSEIARGTVEGAFMRIRTTGSRSILAAVTALAVAAAGCGGSSSGGSGSGGSGGEGQPQSGGNLVIDRTADSESMDKTTVFDNESIWIFEQIMEPLYTVTKDGKNVEPWLATSYTLSPDKKTYTFKL